MTIRTKPDGGFRFIGAYELLGVYFAYSANLIRWYDVRVWFACQEAVARRCRAPNGVPPRYRKEEIQTLVGDTRGKPVRAALGRLQKAGLLRWSQGAVTFAKSPEEIVCDDLSEFWMMVEDFGQANRKVPVPRRTIRFIASGTRKVLTATMIGHLLRCCYFRRGEYASEGSCSAAWVALVFGLDERNVKIARTHLVAMGWLAAVKSAGWHRQRFGGRWAVKPDWSWRESRKEPPVFEQRNEQTDAQERSPQMTVLDSKRSPLLILKENSFGSKNQKPASAADRPTGVCKPNSHLTKPPTLKHIVLEDLRHTARTVRLFEEAAKEGLVRRCEADQLKMVAAAERALRVARNPCGFFATLVRNRLWHHVNQEEEDLARRKLQRHYLGRTPPPCASLVVGSPLRPELSLDAKVVAAVKRTLARHHIDVDPFEALRRERPDWSLERWLRAEVALSRGEVANPATTHIIAA